MIKIDKKIVSWKSSSNQEIEPVKKEDVKAHPRPRTLESETHKIKLEIGSEVKNAYVTVSFVPGTKKPYEVLINSPVGDSLKDMQIIELSARMTSLALRHKVPVKFIAEQLNKIDGQYIYSIPTNLSTVLSEYIEDGNEIVVKEVEEEKIKMVPCPDCKKLTYRKTSPTCGTCENCGYAGCG